MTLLRLPSPLSLRRLAAAAGPSRAQRRLGIAACRCSSSDSQPGGEQDSEDLGSSLGRKDFRPPQTFKGFGKPPGAKPSPTEALLSSLGGAAGGRAGGGSYVCMVQARCPPCNCAAGFHRSRRTPATLLPLRCHKRWAGKLSLAPPCPAAGVSSKEGRTSESNNIIIGSDQSEEKWRELDGQVCSF